MEIVDGIFQNRAETSVVFLAGLIQINCVTDDRCPCVRGQAGRLWAAEVLCPAWRLSPRGSPGDVNLGPRAAGWQDRIPQFPRRLFLPRQLHAERLQRRRTDSHFVMRLCRRRNDRRVLGLPSPFGFRFGGRGCRSGEAALPLPASFTATSERIPCLRLFLALAWRSRGFSATATKFDSTERPAASAEAAVCARSIAGSAFVGRLEEQAATRSAYAC